MLKFKITYIKVERIIRKNGTRFSCGTQQCTIIGVDLRNNRYLLSAGMHTEIENSPGLLNGFEELLKSKSYVIIQD